MKKLVVLLIVLWGACNNPPPQAYHEVRIDPATGQQIVYVHNSDGSELFMDYLLFNTLFNSGGYGSVYGYYGSHRGYYQNTYHSYNSYAPTQRYYGKQRDQTFRPSSPGSKAPAYTPARPSSPSSSSPPAAFRPPSPRAATPTYHAPTPTYRPATNSYKPSSSSYRPSSPGRSGRR